ncbi:MAG: hypothetical protein M0Z80_08485 [Treponema sp.]|nr:hypothetical protein [Treponema sp.]
MRRAPSFSGHGLDDDGPQPLRARRPARADTVVAQLQQYPAAAFPERDAQAPRPVAGKGVLERVGGELVQDEAQGHGHREGRRDLLEVQLDADRGAPRQAIDDRGEVLVEPDRARIARPREPIVRPLHGDQPVAKRVEPRPQLLVLDHAPLESDEAVHEGEIVLRPVGHLAEKEIFPAGSLGHLAAHARRVEEDEVEADRQRDRRGYGLDDRIPGARGHDVGRQAQMQAEEEAQDVQQDQEREEKRGQRRHRPEFRPGNPSEGMGQDGAVKDDREVVDDEARPDPGIDRRVIGEGQHHDDHEGDGAAQVRLPAVETRDAEVEDGEEAAEEKVGGQEDGEVRRVSPQEHEEGRDAEGAVGERPEGQLRPAGPGREPQEPQGQKQGKQQRRVRHQGGIEIEAH